MAATYSLNSTLSSWSSTMEMERSFYLPFTTTTTATGLTIIKCYIKEAFLSLRCIAGYCIYPFTNIMFHAGFGFSINQNWDVFHDGKWCLFSKY